MFCDEDQIETYDISEKDSLEHTEYKIIKENRYYRGSNLKVSFDIIPTNKPYKNNLAR